MMGYQTIPQNKLFYIGIDLDIVRYAKTIHSER